MFSHYSEQPDKEATRRDSLVYHPTAGREERLRDWLASEAFSLAFQGRAETGQGQAKIGEELFRQYQQFRVSEAFKALERELEEYEKKQGK